MPTLTNYGIQKLNQIFSNIISNKLKELLETKHLYQNAEVAFTADDLKGVDLVDIPKDNTYLFDLDNWNIILEDRNLSMGRLTNPGRSKENDLFITPPGVKLYCNFCKRREAFNLNSVSYVNIVFNADFDANTINPADNFTLSYICQSCKSFLEVFLISYKNKKLTICGRSPIEYIEVPKSIPKNAQQYYSDALLAYQSGQHLAGNFMLRVLIEQ